MYLTQSKRTKIDPPQLSAFGLACPNQGVDACHTNKVRLDILKGVAHPQPEFQIERSAYAFKHVLQTIPTASDAGRHPSTEANGSSNPCTVTTISKTKLSRFCSICLYSCKISSNLVWNWEDQRRIAGRAICIMFTSACISSLSLVYAAYGDVAVMCVLITLRPCRIFRPTVNTRREKCFLRILFDTNHAQARKIRPIWSTL